MNLVVEQVLLASGHEGFFVFHDLGHHGFETDLSAEIVDQDIVTEVAEKSGCEVVVVEPYIESVPEKLAKFGNVHLMDMDEALKTADIAVFLVGHNEFKKLDTSRLSEKVVIDTIGMFV